jgi:hypothetical protein
MENSKTSAILLFQCPRTRILSILISFSFSFYTRDKYTKNMLNAFVFLNCDIGTEPAIVSEISDIASVSEVVQVSGVSDIVTKVSEERSENIAKSVKKICAIANMRSSLTMIISEEHAMTHMEVA